MLTLYHGHYEQQTLQKRGAIQLLNKRPLTLRRGLQPEEDTVAALCWVTARHRRTQSNSVWGKIMLWSDHSHRQPTHWLLLLISRSQNASWLSTSSFQCAKVWQVQSRQRCLVSSGAKVARGPSPRIHWANFSLPWALGRPMKSSLLDSKDWHLWTEIPQHCVKINHMVSRQQTPRIRGCVFGGGGYFSEWKDLLLHMQPCFKERWKA